MKKVLIITYFFPPTGGGGVQRPLKFIKYLRDFGWEPVVLTPSNPFHHTHDESLMKDIPENLEIFKAPIIGGLVFRALNRVLYEHINPKWYHVPDDKTGWLPAAVRKGVEILANGDFQAIVSTSPPPTCHIIARRLKERTKIPWVADFRDAWTSNHHIEYPTARHRALEEKLERRILLEADAVITVSDPIKNELALSLTDSEEQKMASSPHDSTGQKMVSSLHDSIGQKPSSIAPAIEQKFYTIPNGFDPDDFPQHTSKDPEKLIITHNGSLYGIRSPIPLFKAISGLPSSIQDDIRVRFIGFVEDGFIQAAKDLNLKNVEFAGYLSHDLSLYALCSSHVALLIIGKGKGFEGMITGKLFEYLGSDLPIMALTPSGKAKEMLNKMNCRHQSDPEDVEEIRATLIAVHKDWKNGVLESNYDPKLVEKYTRKNLTGKLARALDASVRNSS